MSPEDIERWSPFRARLYSLFNRTPQSNLAVVDLAELSGDDRFLDVGCGPGAALQRAAAAGARVAGVDPSPAMVARASHRVPAADVKVGSAEGIPFDDRDFSVAVSISSFHHWSDRDAGLREILRVLAPGGRIYIAESALRDGRYGHGLDLADAELLATRLAEIGYFGVGVQRIKPGWRRRYFVISGSAPT